MDKKEKEEIIRNLYWDYDIVPAVVLKLIEHPNEGDEAKLRKLFIRAFENHKRDQRRSEKGGKAKI